MKYKNSIYIYIYIYIYIVAKDCKGNNKTHFLCSIVATFQNGQEFLAYFVCLRH